MARLSEMSPEQQRACLWGLRLLGTLGWWFEQHWPGPLTDDGRDWYAVLPAMVAYARDHDDLTRPVGEEPDG